MSFSFYVKTGAPPPLRALLDALALPDLRCDGEEEIPNGLRPGFYFHLYRQGLSTRGVEVGFDEGRLQARVLACASADEYELALSLCEAAARAAGVNEITTEEGETLALGDRGPYDAAWIEQMGESSCSSLMAMAKLEQHRERGLTLYGPLRPFQFGPRCVAELEAAREVSAAWPQRRLEELMRRVQYPDEDLYVAKVIEFGKEGRAFTACVLARGVSYFLTRADYLAIDAGEARPIFVAFDAAASLVGERWEWLDDDHANLTRIPDEDWSALLDAALPLAQTPLG